MSGSGYAPDSPGPTPQQTAVRNVQRIQQRIIRLNTQYSHVLAGFNLALERLNMHLLTARPPHDATPWDSTTARLATRVDRLALELEDLTSGLDQLVQEFSVGHEELGRLLGLRSPKSAPAAVVLPRSTLGVPAAPTVAPRETPPDPRPPGELPRPGRQ